MGFTDFFSLYRLHNNGMTAEEMMEIMNAVGDEDLEVQRALAEAFERNHNNYY
jgi:hypothetical protein